MTPRSFMLIAGEPSGDVLAAELVRALQQSPELQASPIPARFFGAGGPKMAEAGVELALDLTKYSVIGLWEVVKKYFTYQRLCHELVELACRQQPDVIICVDFSEFNRNFARLLRQRTRGSNIFNRWQPKLVKYISPQVWASRPGRAEDLARDHDLLLSIFPFEKKWYAERFPNLRVEFVGHPMIDRFAGVARNREGNQPGCLLLLPGSRVSELRRHLPVMMEAAKTVVAAKPMPVRMVVPDESLLAMVAPWRSMLPDMQVQVGGLADVLTRTDVAISKTGTITMECAYFRVPAVTLYKTSWLTYLPGKYFFVTVRFLSMPNLFLDEAIYPEFVQGDATAENLSREALDLLNNPARRSAVQKKLEEIVASLGGPGASVRAAKAIMDLAG